MHGLHLTQITEQAIGMPLEDFYAVAIRIMSILAPIVLIVLAGFWYGR